MISLIEVICPHCGARGQITLPPVGAIVIGPCPQCEELVVVFCGKVLALDKDAMMYGSPEQKREHLMTVLTSFLEEKLAQISFDLPAEEGEPAAETEEEADADAGEKLVDEPVQELAISAGDMEHFVNEELALLDNRDYFKAVFG